MFLLGLFIDELDEEGMMDEEDEEDYEGEEEVDCYYIIILLMIQRLCGCFIYLANLISISYEHSLAYAYNKMNSELFIHLFV